MSEYPSGSESGRILSSRRGRLLGAYIFLCLGAVLMLGPFVWQLLSSFKTVADYVRVPPSVLPHPWHYANYSMVVSVIPFGRMFINTALIAVAVVAGHLLFGAMAAYAFACLRFPGRNAIFAVLLSVLMVPRQLLLIPQYEIVQHVGWINTVQGIALPNIVSVFTIFLLRQFFRSLPTEILEAARLDGAGPARTFWYVMLPLAQPGLIAAAIITVVSSWSDLLWPLVVAADSRNMPLTAGLALLQGEYFTNYPVILAGAALGIAPVIVLFVVLQKQFIQGVAFTGGRS